MILLNSITRDQDFLLFYSQNVSKYLFFILCEQILLTLLHFDPKQRNRFLTENEFRLLFYKK